MEKFIIHSKEYRNHYGQFMKSLQAIGYSNRGFNYKVLYWDNIQALRAKVKRHLQGQLDQLELTAA